MLKVFGIETGDNEESRADAMDVDFINQEQQGQLFNLLCDAATSQYTDKGLKICRAFKFQNISGIRAKDFDKILKAAS